MMNPGSSALAARMRPFEVANQNRPSEMLTTYCGDVNYLRRTYVTDEIITESNTSLLKCVQPDQIDEKEYAHAIGHEALGCGNV